MENTIRIERAKIRISQEDLSKKIGVSLQSIHSIENGKCVPSVAVSMKIARFFNVKVEDIFILQETD